MTEVCRIDQGIYDFCLKHLRDVRDLDFVVPNSLPIPYFGNLSAYLASPLRVLTAALNPSNAEFPSQNPRFDIALGARGPSDLEAELSAYFTKNPYRAWFSTFEPVLNGLGASYGGKMTTQPRASTALHVDICSPIATSPTWSGLRPEQREKLTVAGREVFERLVEALEPQIVVASLGWAHLKSWEVFSSGRSWERVIEHRTAAGGADLRAPLLVQMDRIVFPSGHSTIFVNASAANTPFGRFTTKRKLEAGEALLGRLRPV